MKNCWLWQKPSSWSKNKSIKPSSRSKERICNNSSVTLTIAFVFTLYWRPRNYWLLCHPRLSTSICLVLTCWTGLFAITMTALLSQYNIIGFGWHRSRTCKSHFIHNNPHTPWVILWNYALALDLATIFYFLLRHVT